jgi:hypothetical protein
MKIKEKYKERLYPKYYKVIFIDLGPDDLHVHLDQLLDPCTQTKPTQHYAKWQCHLAG